MAKIKVSELAQLRESYVNEQTSLLAVDNNQSYQLKYGFLSSNLSSNLYRPIVETVSAECDIQQQKNDIATLLVTSNSISSAVSISALAFDTEIAKKLNKDVVATSSALGLIKLGYESAENSKYYPLSIVTDENEPNFQKAFVYVPWEGGSEEYQKLEADVKELTSVSSYYCEPRTKLNLVSAFSDEMNELKERYNEVYVNMVDINDDLEDIKPEHYVLGRFEKKPALSPADDPQYILSGGAVYDLSVSLHQLSSTLLQQLYPIDSIYCTYNDILPAIIDNIGSWECIATQVLSADNVSVQLYIWRRST